MRWITKLVLRFRSLFSRPAVEQELNEELEFHIECQTEENIRRGMSRESARAAALRSFGGVAQMKEECRDARGLSFLEQVAQDVRHGVRLLWRNPASTAVAIVSLALGIGANVAVFNLINTTLLRQLAVSEPARLVSFYYGADAEGNSFGYADYTDFRARSDVFEDVAAYATGSAFMLSGESAEGIPVAVVTRNYFKVLGCQIGRGRAFAADDTKEVAIISDSFWRRRLGSDPAVVGRNLRINGGVFTVIGVAGAGFNGAGAQESTDLWAPLEAHNILFPWPFDVSAEHVDRLRLSGRDTEWLELIGRLRAGVSREAADTAVQSMAAQLMNPERAKLASKWRVNVSSAAHGAMPPNDRNALSIEMLAFLGISLLVLVSACANVSSLMLARTSARWRELAVRLALGAGRRRLFRQFLTESVMLGLAGGVAALAFALSFPILLRRLNPSAAPPGDGLGLSIDLYLVTFALGVSVLAGLLFGFAPALKAIRQQSGIWLRQGQQVQRNRSWLREALVIGQVSISLVLLVGAGLLAQTLGNWFALNPEFARQNLLVMSFELTPKEVDRFYLPLLERVQRLPGVSSASLTYGLPLDPFRMRWTNSLVENTPAALSGNTVGAGYFETMGIPITRGRGFTAADSKASQRVVVINESMARAFWPGRDPLGRQITADRETWSVVGVAADSRHYDMRRILAGPGPFIYLPVSQYPQARMHLILRPAAPTSFVLDSIRKEIRAVNPNVVLVGVKTPREHLEGMFSKQRTAALITGVLALLALALALSGVYGIVSSSVTARTQEIGIRMALGAPRASVMRLVLRRVLALAVLGAGLGIPLGLAVSRTLLSMLFGVTEHDPLTFAGAAAFVVVVAVAAAALPARRATRVDPLVALRYE